MTDPTTDTLKPIADDLQRDIALGVKIVQAYKTGGKAAAMGLLPEAIAEVKQDMTDVKVALPTIKAGYKTTEFWLIVASLGLFTGYTVAFKKTPPIDVSVLIGTVVSIYTAFRHQAKSA